ncbi:hypothetical protein H8959_022370 [Pygathrix nigripes]
MGKWRCYFMLSYCSKCQTASPPPCSCLVGVRGTSAKDILHLFHNGAVPHSGDEVTVRGATEGT